MYDKICKTCGASLSEFYRTYMLGCPECYRNFHEEIVSALKKIQGKTYHVGKTPKVSKVDRELFSEYERLIKEREEATISGKFSRINDLTAEMNDLAEELKRRGIL